MTNYGRLCKTCYKQIYCNIMQYAVQYGSNMKHHRAYMEIYASIGVYGACAAAVSPPYLRFGVPVLDGWSSKSCSSSTMP